MEPVMSYSRRIHIGVLFFYLAQGLCFSTWASRIPDIKDLFNVQDLLYWGMVLFLIPVGKFVAIPLAGWLVNKLGSRIMVQVSILGYALSLFLIGYTSTFHSLVLLGIFLFFFGVFWNLCDISLNTQGIGIEKMSGKTIMATFHGAWSLAACLGALIGYFMIISDIAPAIHFTIVAVAILIIVTICRRYLQEDVAQEPTIADTEKVELEEKKTSVWSYVRRPEMILIQLGIVGFFALIVESAMFDWSGIYFQSVLSLDKSLQIGFLVFMVMMTTGRFLTNFSYSKIGKQHTLQLAGAFIFLGFFITALLGNISSILSVKVVLNSLGFMLVGLGISCMVPTIYTFVGLKSKTPVGIAITLLNSVSFVGSLVAPLLIGSISKGVGMQFAYIIIGLFGLCILLMTSFCAVFRINEQPQKIK